MIVNLIIEDLEKMGCSVHYDIKDKILFIKGNISVGYLTFIKEHARKFINDIRINY